MGRARRQTARVFRKGPSWMARWREDVRRENGQLVRHEFQRRVAAAVGPDAISKRQATRLADELIFKKLDQVSLRPGSLATVAEFVTKRFEPQVVEKRRSDHYRLLLKNHVLPEFGPKRLRDVRRDDIQKFLLEKAHPPKGKALSPQTVKHIRNVLHAIFQHAKRLEYFIGEYPTEFVELPTVEKNPRRELSWEQARALMAKVPAEGAYHWMRTLVFVLATIGLRIGEACGLRWKRLNLTGEIAMVDGEPIQPYTLAVRENYIWRKGGPRYAPLKSKKSKGDIPLPPELVEVFVELRKQSKFVGPDDPVFAGETGRPFDHRRVVSRVLKVAGEAIGLGWVSWHCLRHSAASLGDQVGMSESERQSVLRHADGAMTRHYTHAEQKRVRDGLGAIAAKLLETAPPKKAPAKAKVVEFPKANVKEA